MLKRPLPLRPITLAPGVVLGGPAPLICLPLLGVNDIATALHEVAALPTAERPDLVEWRLDHDKVALTPASLQAALEQAQPYPLPLLVTDRLQEEGGRSADTPARSNLLLAAAQAGAMVDFELASVHTEEFLSKLPPTAPLILSWHHFTGPLEAEELALTIGNALAMLALFRPAAAPTAFKFASFAHTPANALTCLQQLDWLRQTSGWPGPLIGIAMGEQGQHTRLLAPLYGSDLTFATHPRLSPASAPGQLTVAETRAGFHLLRLSPKKVGEGQLSA